MVHTGKYNEVLHRHFSHIPTTSSKGVSAQDALELFLEASFSGPEDVLVFSTAHPFSTEGSLLVLDHERLAVLRYNFTGSDDAVFSFSGSVRPLSAVKGLLFFLLRRLGEAPRRSRPSFGLLRRSTSTARGSWHRL